MVVFEVVENCSRVLLQNLGSWLFDASFFLPLKFCVRHRYHKRGDILIFIIKRNPRPNGDLVHLGEFLRPLPLLAGGSLYGIILLDIFPN
jgi:TRAP-type mannitol/chloroaromatic compound transport system permease small subunit